VNSNYLSNSINQCALAFAEAETKDNPETWQSASRELGNLLQGIGRFDEAIFWHSVALDSQPDLGEIFFQIGVLYTKEEDLDQAIAYLHRALKYHPNAAPVNFNLAQLYGQLGKRDLEIKYWYQAIKIEPELVTPQGYYKLAKAFEQQKKFSEARLCYEQASNRGENLIAAHYDFAEICLQEKNLDQAINCYQKVINQDPQQAKAYYKIGTIYLQQKQYEAAIEQFRLTIKNAPEYPWAYRDLVKTFLLLEKWDEAIATCHAIINLVEEYPWVYVQLGNALREKGRITDTAAAFQKACALRGWSACLENDYYFTRDNFTYRIPLWQPQLEPLMAREGVKILEIGSYQGMSSCWLLDTVLTATSSQLICIDSRVESILKENLAKTKKQEQVTLLIGDTHQHLASFAPETFDVVSLQDKCKLINHVYQNARLTWQLLKVGGLAMFNDYGWRNPANPQQNPQQGIEQFLSEVKDEWELVHRSPQANQLVIRKI
jgi:tetratricopeptide (TPR) repeat protein/predicted O-methyltransferase YrrM